MFLKRFFVCEEQVMGLQQRGIRAEYMGSAQIDQTVPHRAQNGEYDVLYMTPEKACSASQRCSYSK